MRAKVIALGGVTAALALVIMCMGGIIPVATYVCPALCCILLQIIFPFMGKKGSWVWYGTVSVLSALMAPDKEAAAVFVFLGHYPILKPMLDKLRFGYVLKLLMFNAVTLVMYGLLVYLFGMTAIVVDFREMGAVLCAFTLLLGNVTFILLDTLLGLVSKKIKSKGH